jgi:hypothetical protein
MKTAFAALLLGLSATAAQAETFTFTSSFTSVSQIAVPVAGSKSMFLATRNLSTLTYASGKKTTLSGTCAGWSAPSGSTSAVTGICTFSEDAASEATASISCNWTDAKQTQADCWGQMTGMSGHWQGKTGTISWHQIIGSDGKGGTSSGVGMRND